MGSCGSVKKNGSHSHLNNLTNKQEINIRKASASTHIPNGSSKVNGEDYFKKKSVKMSEFERISKETILDGNLINKIKRHKKFLPYGHKQSVSKRIFWYNQKR